MRILVLILQLLVLPLTVAARLQVTALLKQLLQVDMSVLILQLQLWQMAAIQLRSMHLTLMEMRLHRRPLHSRSILYHLHFLSQLRQINWLPTRLRVTVTGTTNDATSSPVTVTVKLNSGTAETVTSRI